jgi:outer membrane protein insertion porin family
VKEDLEKSVNKLRNNKSFLLSLVSFVLLFFITVEPIAAQTVIGDDTEVSYENPRQFEIGNIEVTGNENFDANAIIIFSGLSIGKTITIPSDDLAKAIRNLWKQKLFTDIKINVNSIKGNTVFLNIDLKERSRLSRFRFAGVSKTEADNIRDQIKLVRGTVVNENLVNNTKNTVRAYFIDKGFYNVKVDVDSKPDPSIENSVIITISVDKGPRIKIGNIEFEGNENLSDRKLKRSMKETKEKRWWKIFTGSKFSQTRYRGDKRNLLKKYNEKGFRDATIVYDTVYALNENRLNIKIKVEEGSQFYFRNIDFVGNQKYTSNYLRQVVGIKKGDIYNQETLEKRLFMDPAGGDLSSLYSDDGYLAFRPMPVEVLVENDSIDLEIRIYEGKQFRVNRVSVRGNTKTNDHVVMREIRTRPGDLFDRSAIMRTQRELANLGYFDPEAFNVNTNENMAEGTVDLEYIVEERPADQIELAGGWGAGMIIGTLGVSFNNFSVRNFFKKEAWAPVPSGDGQRLSLRAQSNGRMFQMYSLSFTEPWLGGRKPNSLSVSLSHSVQSNGRRAEDPLRQALFISGGSVGLGKRLRWPDDYFVLMQSVSYQYYQINNFQGVFTFADGTSHNLAYNISFSRNSVSEPLYPRFGSEIRLDLRITPPFSMFSNTDFADATDQEKFRFVEYHKWKFVAQWYTELAPKLVLSTRTGFGFMGFYNSDIGFAPFERFYLGGSALAGFALDGREIIALRGYDDRSLSPFTGSPIIAKYTAELRYPLSLNPSATIYGLGFLEAGNTWDRFEDFNPFFVYRSAGVGLRIFLPMFGLMGLDYGWRFDELPSQPNMAKSQFHFTLGMQLGEL